MCVFTIKICALSHSDSCVCVCMHVCWHRLCIVSQPKMHVRVCVCAGIDSALSHSEPCVCAGISSALSHSEPCGDVQV